jgi:predicted unusual protein kinase regulating ubiquinone biosynthesis (AarF/ABC1/UbiB family)
MRCCLCPSRQHTCNAHQAGQFLGARADFVPDQICRRLALLQDRVPPMSPERARQVREG